jgi:hypothetical protein
MHACVPALQEAEVAARKELEAIMGDSNQSENARRRAKDALRKQAEEMAALTAKVGCWCAGCTQSHHARASFFRWGSVTTRCGSSW